MLLRTSIAFGFVTLITASLGCSSEECSVTVKSSSHEVPECSIPFCAPTERHLVLSNSGGGPGLEASCNGAYCALTFTQGDASIYLSFDPALAQSGIDDSSIHDRFSYLWAQVDFPDAPTDHSNFDYQTESKRGVDAAFESLSFANGRLKATIHDRTKRVEQHVVSDEAGCRSGDVGGECFCDYQGFDIPVVIDLDLSVGPIHGGN
jgi:hypothetical protein